MAAVMVGWPTHTHARTLISRLVRELQIAQSVTQQGLKTQTQKVLMYHTLTHTHMQRQTVLIFLLISLDCMAVQQHRADTHVHVHICICTQCVIRDWVDYSLLSLVIRMRSKFFSSWTLIFQSFLKLI